jgi:hypothetical protein
MVDGMGYGTEATLGLQEIFKFVPPPSCIYSLVPTINLCITMIIFDTDINVKSDIKTITVGFTKLKYNSWCIRHPLWKNNNKENDNFKFF